MTALDALRIGLARIQDEQTKCINKAGYILTGQRYEYQQLVKQAKEYKQAIEYLTQIKEDSQCKHNRIMESLPA